MHVAEIKKTYKGKLHVTTLVRRTFREDGKVKHETIANISRLPQDLIASIKVRFKTGQPLTTHQWTVWSGHQPARQYLCSAQEVPRFVTEFGLQSLPGVETIKSFCPPEQMRIGTYAIEKHN